MTLSQLKALLRDNADKSFLLRLPDERAVPHSFHITEVGLVTKRFIDCGGQVHEERSCQLQAWLGPDLDHRIEAGKMASILGLAREIVPDDSLPVTVEYEDGVVSQYPVERAEIGDDAVTLVLTTRHTDCLAKELCLVPANAASGCTPGGGCC